MCPIAVRAAVLWLSRFLGSRLSKTSQGEVNTPSTPGERKPQTLKADDLAPDLNLPDPTGKETVTLSNFRGKKPVALIFSSYT